jgi:hypothetical protein
VFHYWWAKNASRRTFMSPSGRESRNATGIENQTPGPVQGGKLSSTPGMTGIRYIATSGRMIATLLSSKRQSPISKASERPHRCTN